MRGLGSGRQGARQGFATALALLLGQQLAAAEADDEEAAGQERRVFVDAGDVLTLLDTCLEAGRTMKAGVRGMGAEPIGVSDRAGVE